MSDSQYLYGLIQTRGARNFGPIGIGRRGDMVTTINYEDLAAVVSRSPVNQYPSSEENLVEHTKVIERVMQEYTVLPMRFCTIAGNASEIRFFLRQRYYEFKNLFREFDNKVELGLKARWKDFNKACQEVLAENPDLSRLKEELASLPNQPAEEERVKIGQQVQLALAARKEAIARKLLNSLRRLAVRYKENTVQEDLMIINAVFLVDRQRLRDFDFCVEELAVKYPELNYDLIGPTPPFNFINIVLK